MDARADLFSLGVILFEMLTGQRLRPDGNDMRSLECLEPDLDALSSAMDHISEGMVAVVCKALANVEGRYLDARAMADALVSLDERSPSKEDFAAFVGDHFVGERQAQQALLGDSLAHFEAHRISSRPPITPEPTDAVSGRFPLVFFAIALLLIAWIVFGPW